MWKACALVCLSYLFTSNIRYTAYHMRLSINLADFIRTIFYVTFMSMTCVPKSKKCREKKENPPLIYDLHPYASEQHLTE